MPSDENRSSPCWGNTASIGIEQALTKFLDEPSPVAPVIDALTKSLSILGQKLQDMEQSRDRVLRENCDMLQVVRDLKDLARAAARARRAEAAYEAAIEDGGIPSDAKTQEAAVASCEFEACLEKYAPLYRR